MRTAESVVLTLWPPGPDERNTSMRRSFGSIWMSTSSASGSTSTPAAEVWIASLRLGGRHPLHAVHSPSYLSRATPDRSGCGPVPRQGRRTLMPPRSVGSWSSTSVRPAVPLGVAQVHPQQIAREQRRLVAALTGLDLEDDVLAVVRILGQQQFAQPLLELVDAHGQRLGLGGEGLVFGDQFLGRGEIRAGGVEFGRRRTDRREHGVAAPERARPRLVGVHPRIGQGLRVDVGVFQAQRRQTDPCSVTAAASSVMPDRLATGAGRPALDGTRRRWSS